MAGGPAYATTNNCCASCGSIDDIAGQDNTNWPIDISITAPDGDLPIAWCGITWAKSTTPPAANQVYSGDVARICPQKYKEVTDSNVNARHLWLYDSTGGRDLYLGRSHSSTQFANRIVIRQFQPPQLSADIQAWIFTTFLITTQYDLGILTSSYPKPYANGVWTIPSGWFSSHTVGNVTYTWSRESAGIAWP